MNLIISKFQIAVPMSMEFDDFAKQRENGADEINSKEFISVRYLLWIDFFMIEISLRFGWFHRRRGLREILGSARVLCQVH